MNKLSKKIIAACGTLAVSGLFLVPAMVGAQNDAADYGLSKDNFNINVSGSTDLKGTIAKVINIVLGFLGIIAVVIILAGGFKWMTAAGNEDKVGEARKMITQGIIGLIIIFAAWGIAGFVINNLASATTA